MDTESRDTPATMAPLSLAAASAASSVSVVTLRKHLAAGRLAGVKVDDGPHGATWQIEPAELAAFIGARYGRAIDLAGLPQSTPESVPRKQADTESMAELRERLETTLVELGRYRALNEASEAADQRVEDILKAQIAELRQERDAAQQELDRVKSRGWWARVFGGSA